MCGGRITFCCVRVLKQQQEMGWSTTVTYFRSHDKLVKLSLAAEQWFRELKRLPVLFFFKQHVTNANVIHPFHFMIKSLQKKKKHKKCYLQFCHHIIPLNFLLRFDNIPVKQVKSNPSPPSPIKKTNFTNTFT